MLTEEQREICKNVFTEFEDKSTEFCLAMCADRTELYDKFLDKIEKADWYALGFRDATKDDYENPKRL